MKTCLQCKYFRKNKDYTGYNSVPPVAVFELEFHHCAPPKSKAAIKAEYLGNKDWFEIENINWAKTCKLYERKAKK